MLKWYVNSRLDQGLNNNYLCPTCRKPLFVGRPEDDANPRAREVSSDEQLARQISSRLDRLPPAPNLPGGVLPDQTVNPLDGSDWRFVCYFFLLWSVTKIKYSRTHRDMNS